MTTSIQNPIRFVSIEAEDITKSFLEATFPSPQSVYAADLSGKSFCIITLELFSELKRLEENHVKDLSEGTFTLKNNADWDKFLDHTVGEWERNGSPDPFESLSLVTVSFEDLIQMISVGSVPGIIRLGDGIHQEKVILEKNHLFKMIKEAFAK